MFDVFLQIVLDYWFWGGLGFLIGSILIIRNCAIIGMRFPMAVFYVITGLYGGLFGTRILDVAIHRPELFIKAPAQTLAFWYGGLSWQGGIIGGMTGVFIVSRIAKQSFWRVGGCWAPGLALAHAISRIGCICHGCCFGRPTDLPWAIYSDHLNTGVHPTPVYSIIGEGVVFMMLQIIFEKRPAYRKYLLLWYMILFSIHRFFQEFFRYETPGPEWINGATVYQSICLILISVALGLFLLLLKKPWSRCSALTVLLITLMAFMFL